MWSLKKMRVQMKLFTKTEVGSEMQKTNYGNQGIRGGGINWGDWD